MGLRGPVAGLATLAVCTVGVTCAVLLSEPGPAAADTFRDVAIPFGDSGSVTPLTGDWTGTGRTDVGAYDPSTGTFSLGDPQGHIVSSTAFGDPGWRPDTGDWDGSGSDQIGAYDPSTATFFLGDSGGQARSTVVFGDPDWVPLVGDWDGSGTDQIGAYDPSTATFYLGDSGGQAKATEVYGDPGDIPVTGDWTGTGRTEIGVFRPSNATFYLHEDVPPPAQPAPTPPTPRPLGPVHGVPVTTTLAPPRVGRRPRVRLRVTESWTWNHRRTVLHRFRIVGRSRRHTVLSIACHGGHCPFLRETFRVPARGGPIRHLAGVRFRAGDRIAITISSPHRLPERATIRIRNGRVPVLALTPKAA